MDEDADSIMGPEDSEDGFDDPLYGDESGSQSAEELGFEGQSDPQILKLQDRVKFFSHRCKASLGNNMFAKAYHFLKDSNAEGASPDEKREGLI